MAMGKAFVLMCVLALVVAQESTDFYPIPNTSTTDLPEFVENQFVLMVWQVLFYGTQVDQEFITTSESCYTQFLDVSVFVNQTGQPSLSVDDPNDTDYTLWYWTEVRDVDFNFYRDLIVEYTRDIELGRCVTGESIVVNLTEVPSQLVTDIDAPVPFWAIYIIIGVLMVAFGGALAFLWWREIKKPAYEITQYVEAITAKET
uniref:Uncharacterized protein n=1 Tax=Rhodosorus marinus TaxID=101924 RepID=A0A7S0G720_9RHOD|mmetsp:Transcript_25335/g.36471  ORF Transcript_25335/g.36471 Transcript_25335/m.36471 type:complete len:202 (+) Transcript_25335:178-783(+)